MLEKLDDIFEYRVSVSPETEDKAKSGSDKNMSKKKEAGFFLELVAAVEEDTAKRSPLK